MLVDPHLPSKIFQGITTEITGEGGSVAPLERPHRQGRRTWSYEHLGITPDWRTFAQYFARLEKQGMGINLATYVGATQVRRMVLGDDDEQPTPAQLDEMKRAGAARRWRTGRSACPRRCSTRPRRMRRPRSSSRSRPKPRSTAASTRRTCAPRATRCIEALDEAIRIGREAHIPVEIWHIKAAGKENFGRMRQIVAKVEQAAPRRRRGDRRHVRLYRVVQHVLGVRPAVGARRRRREAARAPEGSRDARAHAQGHARARRRLGQRVAGDARPRGHPDLRRRRIPS